MRITENLYVYLWQNPRENNCNSVVITGKVPVLIDPGHREYVPELFRRMTEDGLNPKHIKAVICTHGHLDHGEGLAAFDSQTVYRAISLRERQYIEEMKRAKTPPSELFLIEEEVEFYLQEGDLILGRHEFQVIHTPGHTPGGISLYWPRYRVLITGDVVFYQGIGRYDFPGGDAKMLQESLKRLASLPTELLIPGHNTPISGQDRIRENFLFVQRLYFS